MVSVPEKAASNSTTMFNSSEISHIHILTDKQLNLPMHDLSSCQKPQSPCSISLPVLPELSLTTSTVTLQSLLSASERENIYK